MADDITELDSRSNVADFCSERAAKLELEIERKGIALEINWNDEMQVQQLAKEALEHAQDALALYAQDHSNYRQKAKVELFGLAAMMMGLMRESAGKGIHTHGGTAWKAFSRALMQESGITLNSDDK